MASYGCELWWDANPPADNVVGYYVYCGANSGVYNDANSPRWVGNVTHAVYIVSNAGTWYLAVAAKNVSGDIGGLSQEQSMAAVYGTWAPVGVPALSVR